MQILNRAADLDDLTHIFVAEDIALLHGRNVAIIQMQIGAADRRCRDLDDGITGLRIFGSGTVATRTSFLPYQQRAFIICLLVLRACRRLPCCRRRLARFHELFETTQAFTKVLPGFLAEECRDDGAESTTGRVIFHADPDEGTAPARRCFKAHAAGMVRSAPASRRQAIRASGRSSVISASHSTVVPAGPCATQCECRAVFTRTELR